MTSEPEQILFVTRDTLFGQTMEKHLTDNGYKVSIVDTPYGEAGIAHPTTPALVLVDRRQQDIAQLRRASHLRTTPFIGLLPPGQIVDEEECVKDLEQDLDMVLFNQGYREIIARVRSVLRRARLGAISKSRYVIGRLCMDIDRHEVTVNGRSIELTPKEFRILQQLMVHPSRVFSRDELLDRVWGEECALEEHIVDVHIHSLRQKVEPDPAQPRYIVTIRGIGYKLRAE